MTANDETYSIDSPRRARRADAGTSRAAARVGHERTVQLRRRIVAFLGGVSPQQATADELWRILGEPMGVNLYEVRRRVSDLRRAGLIVDSGFRGETATGSRAIVWAAAPGTDGYDGSKAP